MILKSRMLAKSDNFGNDLYLRVFSDENNKDVGASIYLKLKSENKRRNIGTLFFNDRSLHVIRDSGKHYHYISKSYGFNWNIIDDDFLNIKSVHLVVDKSERYIIPKSVMETYGKFLNFKQQGFELQKFLPLDMIKNFRDLEYNPNIDPIISEEDEK
jgi:hypothetical protein